jgi:hypothetical protein
MPVIKVLTEVKGVLFDAQIWLEGNETALAYDGNETRMSTDYINVEGEFNIAFHGVGIAGTGWTVTVTLLEPQLEDPDEAKFYKNQGSIRPTGHSVFVDSEPLPALP